MSCGIMNVNLEDEVQLRSLFEEIYEDKKHTDEVCLKEILFLFDRKENNDIFQKLPLVIEWIIRAIKYWEENLQTLSPSVCTFILQLLSIVSVNEVTCAKFLKDNIYHRVINIAQIKNDNSSTIITLGFINLLTSLVHHTHGQHWLLETNYWQNILTICHLSDDECVVKKSHVFISSFLYVVARHDKNLCSKIWQNIINPLRAKPKERFGSRSESNDEFIQKCLGPTIGLINYVLEYFFEISLQKDTTQSREFRRVSSMSEIIQFLPNYLSIIENEHSSYEIGKIWIMLLYLSLLDVVENEILKLDIDEKFIKPLAALLNILVEDSKSSCVLRCSLFILVQWNKLKKKIKIEYIIENNSALIFEEQFIFLLMYPCLRILNVFNRNICDICIFRDMVIDEVYSSHSKIFFRLSCKWRDRLSFKILVKSSFEGISYISQLIKSLPKICLKTIFTASLYLIKDINSLSEKKPHLVHMFLGSEDYMRALFKVLAEIMTLFNSSSLEYVASLKILEVGITFLMNTSWLPQLVVDDLNLMKIATKRYLSSSLALQLKEREDCGIDVLGSLLHSKLHDNDSSVRAAASELVSAIAEVAIFDFQCSRRIVSRSDLNKRILVMSLHDDDCLVRASALQSLNYLVHIEEFWKIYLEYNMTESMILIVNHEKEDLVRAQAVSVLTTVFNLCSPHPHLQKQICNCMFSPKLRDSGRNVRLIGLVFWKKQVEEKLKYYGMVDGQFPKFTFSLESRKIVRLTETEVKRRLVRVLDELDMIGCLEVLKHAVFDRFDIEISKEGWEISRKLNDLIDRYGIETPQKIMKPITNASFPSSSRAFRDILP